MSGDTLPDESHVVRYVKPMAILDDGTADGSGFELRANRPEERGLSVNWLDVFGEDKGIQLSEVRRVFRIQTKQNGRFAELVVRDVLRKVCEEIESLAICHHPLQACDEFEEDPSHSEIEGLPPGGSEEAALVGQLIADCVIEMHPSKNAMRE